MFVCWVHVSWQICAMGFTQHFPGWELHSTYWAFSQIENKNTHTWPYRGWNPEKNVQNCGIFGSSVAMASQVRVTLDMREKQYREAHRSWIQQDCLLQEDAVLIPELILRVSHSFKLQLSLGHTWLCTQCRWKPFPVRGDLIMPESWQFLQKQFRVSQ